MRNYYKFHLMGMRADGSHRCSKNGKYGTSQWDERFHAWTHTIIIPYSRRAERELSDYLEQIDKFEERSRKSRATVMKNAA